MRTFGKGKFLIPCMELILAILLAACFFSYYKEKLPACAQGEVIKKIAITFDDGPHPIYTQELLDGLEKRKVTATFFVVGESAKKYPEIIKRQAELGHLLGNHTYHHVELTASNARHFQEEILDTNRVLQELTGQEINYVRPPYGAWKKSLEKELNMIPVLWTIDPYDWNTTDTEAIVRRVVTNAKENDIILLHDCYDSSVKAALRIVDELQKEGFTFVTVEEILME